MKTYVLVSFGLLIACGAARTREGSSEGAVTSASTAEGTDASLDCVGAYRRVDSDQVACPDQDGDLIYFDCVDCVLEGRTCAHPQRDARSYPRDEREPPDLGNDAERRACVPACCDAALQAIPAS